MVPGKKAKTNSKNWGKKNTKNYSTPFAYHDARHLYRHNTIYNLNHTHLHIYIDTYRYTRYHFYVICTFLAAQAGNQVLIKTLETEDATSGAMDSFMFLGELGPRNNWDPEMLRSTWTPGYPFNRFSSIDFFAFCFFWAPFSEPLAGVHVKTKAYPTRPTTFQTSENNCTASGMCEYGIMEWPIRIQASICAEWPSGFTTQCMSLRFGIAALAMFFVAFAQRRRDARDAADAVDAAPSGCILTCGAELAAPWRTDVERGS